MWYLVGDLVHCYRNMSVGKMLCTYLKGPGVFAPTSPHHYSAFRPSSQGHRDTETVEHLTVASNLLFVFWNSGALLLLYSLLLVAFLITINNTQQKDLTVGGWGWG